MGDPARLRRRTHGGAGAKALALVKPLPPKAVAERPGFTRAQASLATIATSGPMGCDSRPRARAKPLAGGAQSPIRNSIEPQIPIGYERISGIEVDELLR